MFAQQVVNALSQGAFYALFAAGLTLIFGVLGILNLAHGAVFMIGALVSWYLITHLTIGFLPAMAITLVGCGIIGLVLEKAIFRPLRHRGGGALPPLVASLAISFVLINVAERVFGTRVVRFGHDAVSFSGMLQIGEIRLPTLHLVMMIVALLLTAGLWYLVEKTKLGRSIRALQENPDVANLMGVDVDRTIAWVFVIASALAGVAGVFIGVAYNSASPYMGHWIDLKGFAIIILGGMGSIPGALLGGMLIAFAETATVAFFSSDYRDAAAFVVLMAMLLIKPSGLLGSSREVRA